MGSYYEEAVFRDAVGLRVIFVGASHDSVGQFGWGKPTPAFTNGAITCRTQENLKTPAGTINGYSGVCGFGTLPAGALVVAMENYNSALLDSNVPGTWYVIKITPPTAWVLSTPAGTADHYLCWRRYGNEYGRQGGHTVNP